MSGRSYGEQQSLESFWDAVPNADTQERKWMKGPVITLDDLLKGSQRVQRVTAKEWWAGGKPGQTGGGQPVKSAPEANVMGFGKYAARLLADVREDDPSYFSWACRDVKGFEARARKAGLLDEDGEDN